MTIYVDERSIPFSHDMLAKMRALMEKRGGAGFIVNEEGMRCYILPIDVYRIGSRL